MFKKIKKIGNKIYKYTNNTDGIIENVKYFALKKFVKSEYLRDTSTIIPLTIISILTINILNFLLFYRLKTDIYLLDTLLSLIITVILTLFSPYSYNVFLQILKAKTDIFCEYIIKNLWKEGWNFYEYWKVRILISISIFLLIFLQFVEVTSFMLQEFIIHSLLSAVIVDSINNYVINIKEQEQIVKKYANIKIVDSYLEDVNKNVKTFSEYEIMENYEK